MHPLLIFLLVLPLLIRALELPRLLERHPELNYVRELDNSEGYIKFTVPSVPRHKGRESDDDDSVIFELRVLPVATPCGSTDVELNGKALQRQWDGPRGSGHTILGPHTVDEQHRDTHSISWQASCLHSEPDTLQVLTVTIDQPHTADASGTQFQAGFTITFNHKEPDIIFLAPTPQPHSDAIEIVDDSSTPSPTTRLPLAILPVGDRTEDVSSLKEEIEKLRLLPTQSAEFSEAIEGQKQIVHDLFKEEFQKAKDEIKQCQSLSCMVKTTFEKTKGALDLARLRYGPKPKASFDDDPDCRLPLLNIHPVAQHREGQARLAMIQEAPLYCDHDEDFDKVDASEPDGANDSTGANQGDSELASVIDSGFSFFDDVDEPSFLGIKSTKGRFFLAFGVVTSVLCLSCLGTLITRSYCSPRARADRAARREEWRTRREYRCLARRKAWRDFFTRYVWHPRSPHSPQPSGDYEEKRTLILAQEAVLEAAMQREIEALRHPQRLASFNAAAAAEEGRLHPHPHLHPHLLPRAHSPPPSLAFSFSSTDGAIADPDAEPLSRSSSLPSYRSRASSGGSGRPPSYKEYDEHTAILSSLRGYGPEVVDFARLGGTDGEGSDVSPDSSVIEISPRHSSETLRTEYCAV